MEELLISVFAGFILIAACYWKQANNWGAIAAIATGCILPVSFSILQQAPATQGFAQKLGPYKMGVSTYAVTALAMLLGSILKTKLKQL